MNSLLAAPCGDVNSSNTIDILDALMIAQFTIGLHPQSFDQSAAEVSGDGVINIVDALQVAQYSVGLITMLQGCISPPPGTGNMLSQEGNLIHTALDNYKDYLTGDPTQEKLWGDTMVSWQFVVNEGAFPKMGFDHEYTKGIATPAERDLELLCRLLS